MYRIKQVSLKCGIDITLGQLTVAIGPNNGGKSQFLRDLVNAVASPSRPLVSVASIEPEFPVSAQRLFDKIASGAEKDQNGNMILDTAPPDYSTAASIRIHPTQIPQAGTPSHETSCKELVKSSLGSHLVSHLATERRLLLLKRQDNRQANIEGSQTPIEAAFKAPQDVIEKVNSYVSRAFGRILVLDKTTFATAQFRISDTVDMPSNKEDRRQLIRNLPKLDDQGDGIRSFSGVLVAVAAFERPVVIVDEPESFLHPPQAFLLGQALAELSGRAQTFIATHSAEVLRGILSITSETVVVRFANYHGTFFAKQIGPHDLQSIIIDPVLSSVRVLDGLFYNGVAVIESDGDVVLYRSVLERFDRSVSIEFVNSYDKRSSPRIAFAIPRYGHSNCSICRL